MKRSCQDENSGEGEGPTKKSNPTPRVKRPASYRTRRRWALKDAYDYGSTLRLPDTESSDEIISDSDSHSPGESDSSDTSSEGPTLEGADDCRDFNLLASTDPQSNKGDQESGDEASLYSENSSQATSEDSSSEGSESTADELSSDSEEGHISDDDLLLVCQQFEGLNVGHEKLYGGCLKSVNEAVYQIAHSYVKNNKTKVCLLDDLNVMKSLLPSPNKLPKTPHRFFKYVRDLSADWDLVRHFCCQECGYYWGTEDVTLCTVCSSKEGCNPFFVFNVIDQLKFFFEHKNLGEVLDKAATQRNTDPNFICDVTDGSEYQRVNLQRGQYDLTLLISSDGACLKKSSKADLWVLSFMIAEVPVCLRRQFMACSSVWYASKKPEMNAFLQPFCVKLRESFNEGGFEWTDSKTEERRKSVVHCPLFIGDAPARAMALNTLLFNGEYGCNLCEVQTQQTAPVEGLKCIRVYKYSDEGWRLRTKRRMIYFGNLADDGHPRRYGVKGSSIVSILPGADISTFTVPEILHSVGLGVVKQVIGLWVSKAGNWSLKSYLPDIDKFLLEIQPPDTFCRLPRKLSEYHFWKGYECFYWCLFYSLVAVKGLLDDCYFQHWMLFVIALDILFQEKINVKDLETAERLLALFVKEFESLYGERELTYNLHQMLHLCLCVRRWGPLWGISAFAFEDFIGTLSKVVHGSKHIGQEMSNQIHFSQGYQVLKNRVDMSKSAPVGPKYKCLGKQVKTLKPEDEFNLQSLVPLATPMKIYARAKIKGEIFTSKLYRNVKTVSYSVSCETSEGSQFFGSIKCFACVNRDLFVVMEPYTVEHLRIFYHRESRTKVRHLIPIVEDGSPAKIIRVKDLLSMSKVLYLKNYVCLLPKTLRRALL